MQSSAVGEVPLSRFLWSGLFLFVILTPLRADPITSVGWVRAGRDGVGTGFVVDAKRRHLLTNHHVVGQANRIEVFFPVREWGRIVPERAFYLEHQQHLHESGAAVWGKVLRRREECDLALVELESLPADVEQLVISRESGSPGDDVRSIGHRHDSQMLWNLTDGVVRQRGPLTDGYFWQTKKLSQNAMTLLLQSPIVEGDSGGPVLNTRNEVVGVIAATRGRTDVSIAIDLAEVRAFLQEPRTNELAKRQALIAASVWIQPSATDQRACGWVWADHPRLVLTSAKAVGSREFVQVILGDETASSEASQFQDTVKLCQSGRQQRGWVIARDPQRDIALVELENDPKIPGLKLGGNARIGDTIHAISHPQGVEMLWLYSRGIVRQSGRIKLGDGDAESSVLLLQLPTNGASSGGPIVNDRGEVVGLLSHREAPSQQVSYAITASQIRAFLESHQGKWNPTTLDERLNAVKLDLHRGRIAQARERLKGMPNEFAVLRLRAECDLSNRELIDQVSKLRPKDPDVWRLQARSAIALNQPMVAIEFANRAIQADREDAFAFALRAEAKYMMGQNSESTLDVQAAIERSSNVALSYRIHARMLTDAMDYDKAIVALERVGELEPYDRSLPLQRANWWRKRNEWKKARFELNGWLDFAPNDAEYLEQLGDVQRHLSEDASAIRAWFDAMRCDPVRVERIMGKLLETTEPSESWFRTVIEQGNRWLSKNESERKSREMKLHQVLTERDIPLRIQRLRSIVSEFGESIKNAPSENETPGNGRGCIWQRSNSSPTR